jgi:SAM-dependent methyltransferase
LPVCNRVIVDRIVLWEGNMTNVTPEPIMKIAIGFMAAKHLFAASEIGLFATLAEGPAALEQLADKTKVPQRTLGIVAAAMVSLGLLEQDGSHYRNSEVAASFLAGRSGLDLRANLRMLDQISYPMWVDFVDAVRRGEGQRKFGILDERQQQIFSAGVESFTTPVATALAATYDFGRHHRVLDVGGGTGSFLVIVLKRFEALKGTLFELPGACAVAREKLAQMPEGTRIDVVEGDALRDALPAGHDVFIVANTIHVFSASHNVELLRKIREHASAGARLLLVDMWTDPSRSQPTLAALMSGQFLITSGEGQTYSEREADDWLAQTGWKKLERKPLAGPASVIIAETA